jgi:hypothetical protein
MYIACISESLDRRATADFVAVHVDERVQFDERQLPVPVQQREAERAQGSPADRPRLHDLWRQR